MIQRHVFVSGRVQGVGFRNWLKKQVLASPEVRGYVRNLSDGRVEAVFSGCEQDVLGLVSKCSVGPPVGHVISLEVKEEECTYEVFKPEFLVLKTS
ncbi:MAG: acylphosphatase [Candidatus Poribacteria bacterium]